MVRRKIGRSPYLCRSMVMLMTTYKFLRWIHSNERDGRQSRHIGEVLDWHRGDDAGDLKRSELKELVENFEMSQRPRGENLEK